LPTNYERIKNIVECVRLVTNITELESRNNKYGRILLQDAGIPYIEQSNPDVRPSPQVEIGSRAFRGIEEVERFVIGWEDGKYKDLL